MSAASEPIERRVTSQWAINLLRNNPIFVAIALLVIVTSVVEPKFLTEANFDNILRQFGTLIFAALGMTFVIMAGFLDLSIGGIISLVAVVTVTLIDKVGQGPAILIGISVGLICGLINSALIITSGALTQAESLFITFGMSLVYGAVALMYVQGVTQFLTYSTTDISIFNAINSGGIGFLSVSAVLFSLAWRSSTSSRGGHTWDEPSCSPAATRWLPAWPGSRSPERSCSSTRCRE